MQQTLKQPVSTKGVGLHSGREIELILRPAPVDSGIIFIRNDIADRDNRIQALWNKVVDTQLCTVIGNSDGVTVGTVEHLMSALRGMHIDNALIELDGPEVPVLDGSALPFVKLIEAAGTDQQREARKIIRIIKPVSVHCEDKTASLKPAEASIFAGSIEFSHPQIGEQHFSTRLVNGNYKHDIAEARTFGFLSDVEHMRKNGLALGGSLENAVVLDDEMVMNPEGLRSRDEFIRHKLLDAIGDLYLAGAPILGAYESRKAGHALNNQLLKALFADDSAWDVIEVYSSNGSEIASLLLSSDSHAISQRPNA